jgi:hypothetical protein
MLQLAQIDVLETLAVSDMLAQIAYLFLMIQSAQLWAANKIQIRR